ncbi:hypothetical protein B0H14DRAFT_3587279 [Mycena olivaceomarginata]|nr:hypothetical protein B0H14DRAFT_3587279 [Mycena olivaceomarginata]
MKTLWLLIVLLMVFMCPHPCSEVFDKEVGLSVHQNSCQYVNEHNTNLDRAVAARKERKRLKKELKAAAAAAAQPTLESMHDVPQELEAPGPHEDIDMPYQEPEHQPEPPDEEPQPPELTAAGRPVRAKRLTWKLLQQLPPPPH